MPVPSSLSPLPLHISTPSPLKHNLNHSTLHTPTPQHLCPLQPTRIYNNRPRLVTGAGALLLTGLRVDRVERVERVKRMRWELHSAGEVPCLRLSPLMQTRTD
ncbi:hypothetical protein E2C01_064539 [Portunus trituberculatus]|uniref:Uncharacterized protein n=1 Tax=Portunus trituberculatus TaxID=210409 RepID=A0A5B7HL37_PORTR|nr:hypothetical protein [Portunus trituberculatus]